MLHTQKYSFKTGQQIGNMWVKVENSPDGAKNGIASSNKSKISQVDI